VAGEKDPKQLTLLYGLGCFFLVNAVNCLSAVTIEGTHWLVLTACICGFLRAKEVEVRALAKPVQAGWPASEAMAGDPAAGVDPLGARRRRGNRYRPHFAWPRFRSAGPAGRGPGLSFHTSTAGRAGGRPPPR
jgi:hypothetical protein